MAARRHDAAIEALPRLSRPPRKAPKAFGGFGFARMRGRGADAPRELPPPPNLHAHGNLALIGPGGTGEAHPARACGRERCMQGCEACCLKEGEPRDGPARAADPENPSRAASSPARPSRLIVDEAGRRAFDKARTGPFFDVADKRHEKGVPDAPVPTGNAPANNRGELFAGDGTPPCTLDRMFDKASVFVMRGPSSRGAGCDASSAEAVPSVAEARVQGRVPTQIGQSHAGASAILTWPGSAACARLSGGCLCPALTAAISAFAKPR
nr:ATP-binding protein [uncultured Olsenella sp.]